MRCIFRMGAPGSPVWVYEAYEPRNCRVPQDSVAVGKEGLILYCRALIVVGRLGCDHYALSA